MQMTRVFAGTLTHAVTPHRVGPPASSVLREPTHPDLLRPVLSLDGAALGLAGAITFLTSLYDGGAHGLGFARDPAGILTLEDASSQALRAWHADCHAHQLAVEVAPAPTWYAPYLALQPFDVPGPDEHAYWSAQSPFVTDTLRTQPGHAQALLYAWRDAVDASIRQQLGAGAGAPPLRSLPLLLTPWPVWTQRDATPTDLGDPPRFVGQLRADRYALDLVDCEVYLHLAADGRRVAISNQIS